MRTKEEPKTVGEALPWQMARIRDEVMPAYAELGAAGELALMLMKEDLDEAARAMAEGDVVAMIRIYQSLKEIDAKGPQVLCALTLRE